MVYELDHTEAQDLCDKLRQLGYFTSVIPRHGGYNVLIYGRKHTLDMKEVQT